MLARDDQLVLLVEQRHEVEIERAGRRQNAQAGVGRAAGHVGRDGQMGVLLALVAPIWSLGPSPAAAADSRAAPRARAALAIDELHVRTQPDPPAARQPFGLPARRRSGPGRGPPAARSTTAPLGQVPLDVADVVFAGLSSSRCEPARCASPRAERQQAAQAADVGRRQRRARRASRQRVREQIERQVVAADGDDRAADLVEAAQQLDLDLGAGVHPFREARDARQAVGAHHRHDHARAARQRRRHQPLADLAELDPHVLVLAHRRQQLARDRGRDGRPRSAAPVPAGGTAAAAGTARWSGWPTRDSPECRSAALPRATPRMSGWPGRIATPCTSSSPSSRTMPAV